MKEYRKKVLLVHPYPLHRGGIESFLLEWVRHAPLDKYEFTWYCLGEVLDYEMLEEIKPYVSAFIVRKKTGKIKKIKALYIDLLNIIKNNHFDIIHINSGNIYHQVVAIWVADKCNVKMRIAHSHSCAQYKGIVKLCAKKLIQSYLSAEATHCVACSTEAGMSLFGKKVLRSPKWKLVKNTIDTKRFSFDSKIRKEFRKKLNIKDTLLLGCVGNSDENKNHIFALYLIKKLRSEGIYNAMLLLIGEDKLNGKLQREARILGIENAVCFLGSCNCVENWLQAFDIYLMPSKSEGLPISALEAQADGLPCILSDRISREIKFGNNVEFISTENIDLWIDAVKRFYGMEYDREKESQIVCQKGIDVSQIPKYIESLYEIDNKK